MKGRLTLFELNSLIQDVIHEHLDETYWVIAEISEMKVNRSGHCYLELVEKESGSDEIAARARAVIWSYTFRIMKSYFQTTTGQELTEGIKILVQVTVEFHQTYGLSLNIRDIDPVYTLGDIARRRLEIISKLKESGVYDMNRELPLPLVPQRIAIISSSTAAGYQDFIAHLRKNPGRFRFHCTLFDAFMQGSEAVPSILKALDRIFQDEDKFDAVAIIRGGGAQADLGCFDNFELAWVVAQFPLPVITGIGHEKDDTVLDLVAHTRMKTPTAAAEFFISGVAAAYERILTLQEEIVKESRDALNKFLIKLNSLAISISHSSQKYLRSSNTRTERIAQRFRNSAGKYLASKSEYLVIYKSRLSKYSKFLIFKQQNQLRQLFREVRYLAKTNLSREQQRLRQLRDLIPSAVRNYRNIREMKLASSEAALRLLDPQNILRRGFTLTLQDNRIVKSVKELSESHLLETRFFDGQVTSRIVNNMNSDICR